MFVREVVFVGGRVEASVSRQNGRVLTSVLARRGVAAESAVNRECASLRERKFLTSGMGDDSLTKSRRAITGPLPLLRQQFAARPAGGTLPQGQRCQRESQASTLPCS